MKIKEQSNRNNKTQGESEIKSRFQKQRVRIQQKTEPYPSVNLHDKLLFKVGMQQDGGRSKACRKVLEQSSSLSGPDEGNLDGGENCRGPPAS